MNSFLPTKGVLPCTSSGSNAGQTLFKKAFFYLAFFLLFATQAHGQTDSWVFLKEEGGVKVSYQLTQLAMEAANGGAAAVAPADLPQYLKLRIENTTTSDVSVSWEQEVKVNGNNVKVDFNAAPGESIIDQRSMVPLFQLSKSENDGYPKSFTEFMEFLKININL